MDTRRNSSSNKQPSDFLLLLLLSRPWGCYIVSWQWPDTVNIFSGPAVVCCWIAPTGLQRSKRYDSYHKFRAVVLILRLLIFFFFSFFIIFSPLVVERIRKDPRMKKRVHVCVFNCSRWGPAGREPNGRLGRDRKRNARHESERKKKFHCGGSRQLAIVYTRRRE